MSAKKSALINLLKYKNMGLLNWEDDYSVGVKKFDEQHKKMFSMINDFFDLMQENKDKEMLKEILKGLADYGRNHLRDEEEYFDKYGYPEKKAHKEVHDLYRSKIEDFLSKEIDMFLPFEIIDYLEDWWLGHIKGMDSQYASFFKDKGVN